MLRAERVRQLHWRRARLGPGHEVLVVGHDRGGVAIRDGSPTELAEAPVGADALRLGPQRDTVVQHTFLCERLGGRVQPGGPVVGAASQKVEGIDGGIGEPSAVLKPLPPSLNGSRAAGQVGGHVERGERENVSLTTGRHVRPGARGLSWELPRAARARAAAFSCRAVARLTRRCRGRGRDPAAASRAPSPPAPCGAPWPRRSPPRPARRSTWRAPGTP